MTPADIGPLYSEDTVHAFAWFPEQPEGDVTLIVTLGNGREVVQAVTLRPGSLSAELDTAATIARLGARARIHELEAPEQATKLALRYQLLTKHTHYLVVHERAQDEKAEELPSLRKVAQNLAAGWGGTGSVHADRSSLGLSMEFGQASFDHDESLPEVAGQAQKLDSHLRDYGSENLRQTLEWDTYDGLVRLFNRGHPEGSTHALGEFTVDNLFSLGAPSAALVHLGNLVREGEDELAVVLSFLMALVDAEPGKALTRAARRAITKAYKNAAPKPELRDRIRQDLGWQT